MFKLAKTRYQCLFTSVQRPKNKRPEQRLSLCISYWPLFINTLEGMYMSGRRSKNYNGKPLKNRNQWSFIRSIFLKFYKVTNIYFQCASYLVERKPYRQFNGKIRKLFLLGLSLINFQTDFFLRRNTEKELYSMLNTIA